MHAILIRLRLRLRLLGDGCYLCLDTHVESLKYCVYLYHLVPYALLNRDVVFIRTASLSSSQPPRQ